MEKIRKHFSLGLLLATIGSIASLATSIAGTAPRGNVKKTKVFESRSGELIKRSSADQIQNISYPFMAPEEFESAKTEATKRGVSRSTAASDLSDSMMSEKFREKRDAFLKLSTPAELDAFINQLQKEYDSWPADANDLRFFAAQLIPLKSIRGIVWRMVPYVEQTRLIQSGLLNAVKQLAASINVYVPTQQWKAGFDYVSMPFAINGAVVDRLESDTDLQVFLVNEVLPYLLTSAKRIEALKVDASHAWVWDNRLLNGAASFVDDMDRYRSIHEAERHLTLAGLDASISSILFQRAYDQNGQAELAANIGNLYGIDGFKASIMDSINPFSDIKGVSSKSRAEAIHASDFQNLWKLTADGKKWTEASFKFLRQGANHAIVAYNELKSRPASEVASINPAFTSLFSRQTKLSLDNIEAMLSGATELRSVVSGERIKIDLPAFYHNPPSDLKSFYPVTFSSGSESMTVNLGSSVKYRNYWKDQATGWNLDSFKTYFPGVSRNEDIIRISRILSQAWGANPIATSMSFFVL